MFKDGAGAEALCSAAVNQEHFKDMLKEAAREVRDWMSVHHPSGDETALLVARGCARAVWRQDLQLARRLVATSATAAGLLDVGGPQVVLRHPESFHMWTDG
eukprot:7693826-Pyramimonas_sp.AAC.1